MNADPLHPPPFSFREFVERAFLVLEAELPEMFTRLTETLDGARVALEIEGEKMVVDFRHEGQPGSSRIDVEKGWSRPLDARIETEARTILEVIDGAATLQEAVNRGGVRATAELDVLQVLLEGLEIFVHGGVRCPTFPALLASFRSFVEWHAANETRQVLLSPRHNEPSP